MLADTLVALGLLLLAVLMGAIAYSFEHIFPPDDPPVPANEDSASLDASPGGKSGMPERLASDNRLSQ